MIRISLSRPTTPIDAAQVRFQLRYNVLRDLEEYDLFLAYILRVWILLYAKVCLSIRRGTLQHPFSLHSINTAFGNRTAYMFLSWFDACHGKLIGNRYEKTVTSPARKHLKTYLQR